MLIRGECNYMQVVGKTQKSKLVVALGYLLYDDEQSVRVKVYGAKRPLFRLVGRFTLSSNTRTAKTKSGVGKRI